MAAAVAVIATHHMLRTRAKNVAVTLSGSYATPGEVITATSVGLYVLFGASVAGGMGGGTSGRVPIVEMSGTALVGSSGGTAGWPQLTLRFLSTGASSAAALSELADGAYGTELTAKPIVLTIWGRVN